MTQQKTSMMADQSTADGSGDGDISFGPPNSATPSIAISEQDVKNSQRHAIEDDLDIDAPRTRTDGPAEEVDENFDQVTEGNMARDRNMMD